jgi:hypothetical protein
MQALDLSPLEELSREDGYRISDRSMKVDKVWGSRQIYLAQGRLRRSEPRVKWTWALKSKDDRATR